MKLDQAVMLFFSGKSKALKIVSTAFLFLLFVAGLAHWIVSLHGGDFSFRFMDWPKEREYLKVLKTAVTENIIPYYISEEIHMTDKFMGMAETIVSPHILLLKYMDIGTFFSVHLVFMYILGFLGLLLLRKKFNLSLVSFLILFMLFNFNGYIVTRVGVGHAQWIPCLLLPYFVLFVFEMVEGKDKLITAVKLALFSFFILLQGAFHLYVWCMLFLILFVLFDKKYMKPVFLSMLFGWILSAFRFLPSAVAYIGKSKGGTKGYMSVSELFQGMVSVRDVNFNSYAGSLGWWELSLYIDITGFAILAYFGVYLSVKSGFFSKKNDNAFFIKNDFKGIYLALFALIMLTFNRVYSFIDALPIPVFNSQSVSARFIIIPFVFILVFSVIRFNDFSMKLKSLSSKLLLLCGALLLTSALVEYSELWRVKRLDSLLAEGPLNAMSARIIFKEDLFFASVVKYSYLASGVALLAALLFLYFYPKFQKSSERKNS